MKEFAAWLEAAAKGGDDTTSGTNGHFLRVFLVNFAKAIIALLDALGEWPIDVE